MLPYRNPPPGLRTIVIMDNCRIYKSERVQEICDRVDVTLEFLPPYSPTFNPIEASFHDAKAYIRRHYYMDEDGRYGDFEAFLMDVIKRIRRGEEVAYKARAHFRHVGYFGVPDEVGE